jgi:uncharacterized Zn finger protein
MNHQVKCPKCKSTEIDPVHFTWWGLWLGPGLLNLVRCRKCGKVFNRETREFSILAAAAVSVFVVLVIVLIAVMVNHHLNCELQHVYRS